MYIKECTPMKSFSWNFTFNFFLALEYVGVSCRSMCGIYIEIPFALGGILVAFVNYLGIKVICNMINNFFTAKFKRKSNITQCILWLYTN